MDEGDEDREAGIGDEEDGDSDLDLGDDPADAGKSLNKSPVQVDAFQMSNITNSALFPLRRGKGGRVHTALCPPALLSAGPRAAG